MIRDGLDRRPLRICEKPCNGCGATCQRADIEAELRDAGWQPIEDAPLANGIWIEGLTVAGVHVVARYSAWGDYIDRWTNGSGNIVYRLTHWRPKRSRLG